MTESTNQILINKLFPITQSDFIFTESNAGCFNRASYLQTHKKTAIKSIKSYKQNAEKKKRIISGLKTASSAL